MFVRFVVDKKSKRSNERMGLFGALHLLPPLGRLADWDERRLGELRQWFSDKLPHPTRVTRSRRPNATPRALSWFKESATEYIANARELAALYERHDVRVEMLTTDRPGYIVYEDEIQVLAEPFRGESRGESRGAGA